MDTPTDDPGIPALTEDALADLAPFLAAEGIDLSDPEATHDPDALSAAIARASEQHNLRRFTPVHKERDLALRVLIEFTEALEARAARRAEIVLGSVGPQATSTRPAISHVIGAGLGLLDSWHSDPSLRETLGEIDVPRWPGPARSTARKIIGDARRGHAYDSLDQLVARHGGDFVLTSVTLAVAASILTHAEQQNIPLLTAADALFTHRTARPRESPTITERYDAWLAQNVDGEYEDLVAARELFASVLSIAQAAGLDIEDPDDVLTLAETLFELPDRELLGTALWTLQRYAGFQREHDPDRWAQVVQDLAETIRAGNPEAAVLDAAISGMGDVPEDERMTAMRGTRVVAAIPDLLTWIGSSRAVTAAGNLRRTDIEPAAKILGIHAVGVARLPTTYPESTGELRGALPGDVVHAQSMRNVPLLGQWWQALVAVGIIECSSSRVRPGPAAAEPANLALLQQFLAVFVMETILQRLANRASHTLGVIAEVIAHILHALDPDYSPAQARDPRGRSQARDFLESRELEHAGLVRFQGPTMTVPDALRGVVALGTAMAMSRFDEIIAAE